MLATSKKRTLEVLAEAHYLNPQSGIRTMELLKRWRGQIMQLKVGIMESGRFLAAVIERLDFPPEVPPSSSTP